MAEKKPSDSAQKLIAAMKEYRARLEKMSPEERAEQEAFEEAFAKKYLRLINDSMEDFES